MRRESLIIANFVLLASVDVQSFVHPIISTNGKSTAGFATLPSFSVKPFKTIRHTTSSSTTETTKTSTEIPVPKEWKGDILSKLSTIIDPDLNRDIVTLGFVQNLSLDETTRKVSFDVELTTPACPIKEEFQTQCADLVNALPWTDGNANVTMTSQPPLTPDEGAQTGSFGMTGVKSVIAVSSCKGGVGKSTTAVNLAYALSEMGASVGIFDADVYGPSLPTMVTPDNDAVTFVGRQIAPLQRNGVKLMSFGYVNEGSAVMRGPMVTQLLDQFLSMVYWGNLDYLILDMPPGTGDIQLTLSQRLNITAAVIVTTPQELSFVDVERGIEMFDSVNVPCVAVVENMAYIEMESSNTNSNAMFNLNDPTLKNAIMERLEESSLDTSESEKVTIDLLEILSKQQPQLNQQQEKEKVRIFGKGHKKRLSNQWGIDHTYSVPLLQTIASNGDSGTPFILEYPESSQAKIYNQLAASVVREVVKTKYSTDSARPNIIYNDKSHLLELKFGPSAIDSDNTSNDGDGKAEMITMSPATLRRDCKCAACVEELSGRQILQPWQVSENIKPLNMNPTGNYALSVDWSDGHRSLYPYKQIRALLQGENSKDEENTEEYAMKMETAGQ
mmetsp:Transcript_7260/g.10398  ORF Transcript_7260/g.10398 Transcript_7260/m.10398 type:complete len:615 (-) Transcript_7260:257-2101(-)|eukprot:CAMPEP_0184857316 /NCGR_PEP_ID=MMETSP0580-20130426/2472_1 /TAXON_ID=1118495 /ORGANISM="Dactyliosolen fragilissimus" /LENGTH=614 /DNA_ID=CAMNT_0027352839 /DNA_START=151 /DNA_END=1995 /DNA_ORIENTATION=-